MMDLLGESFTNDESCIVAQRLPQSRFQRATLAWMNCIAAQKCPGEHKGQMILAS